MSVRILYFAGLKEALGMAGETVELPVGLASVGALRDWLVGQGSHFEIWSDEGWQQQQDAVFALGDQLPVGLEDLAL